MRATYGSLFSGIGGLDLGLDRAGWECRWQIELDDYCRRVLAKHWPGVKRYGDIRTVCGDELEPVDLIAGGFPCQDVSQAGRRTGLFDADGAPTRSGLWLEFARIVREVRPRFVLAENTPGLLTLSFAPGPSDPRWPDILRERPDLAPALESPLRGVAFRTTRGMDRAMSNRTKRLSRLGNAVVPQCAEWIGNRLLDFASQRDNSPCWLLAMRDADADAERMIAEKLS